MQRYIKLGEAINLQEHDYSIMPVQKEHIEAIRQWRNAQITILRQRRQISELEQINYFEKNIWPSMLLSEPNNILVSFLNHEKLIGYGGLVHTSWSDKRAEVSFLLDPERSTNELTYAKDFQQYFRMIKRIAFVNLKLNKLFTETFDIRPKHIELLEKSGFVREGVLREHVQIKGQLINLIIHGCLNHD